MENEEIFNPNSIKTIKYLKKDKANDWKFLIDFMNDLNDANPYDKRRDIDHYNMWKEQTNLNFPILFLASIYLYIYAKKRNCDTFLFTTRDCCHWYRIFQKLFPEMKVHYFNCSRNMFRAANEGGNLYFDQYVHSIVPDINKCIYADIHGSSSRAVKYFKKAFGQVPHCFLLSAKYKNYESFPFKAKEFVDDDKLMNLIFEAKGSPIEMLNYDKIGTLQTYTKYGPLRDKLEYDYDLIKPYHKCIDYIVENIDSWDNSTVNILEEYKERSILKLLKNIYKLILEKKPTIGKFIKHQGNHKELSKKKIKKLSKISDVVNIEPAVFSLDLLKNFTFINILSNDTVYGVIWNAIYLNKPCVVKIILLSTGSVPNKINVSEEIPPFVHSEFLNKKPMDLNNFLREASNLQILHNKKMAPEVFGVWINNSISDFHYGVIAMEKLDTTVKNIIIERPLHKKEKKLIDNMISNLHKDGIVHGDLKPSNIGVYLNSVRAIENALFLDCQKVKYKKELAKKRFKKMIDHDLKKYSEHAKDNAKLRKSQM